MSLMKLNEEVGYDNKPSLLIYTTDKIAHNYVPRCRKLINPLPNDKF